MPQHFPRYWWPGEMGPQLTLLHPCSSSWAHSLGPVWLEMHEASSSVIDKHGEHESSDLAANCSVETTKPYLT